MKEMRHEQFREFTRSEDDNHKLLLFALSNIEFTNLSQYLLYACLESVDV